MALKITNLSKEYGNQKAVNNVSFEVNTGEIVGFLGPNGAGKSTTMKIIAGYLQATAGSVHIFDQPMTPNNYIAKAKIGYLPEHNPLYQNMYIKEFLEFVGGLYYLKGSNLKKRVAEIIQLVGLNPEQSKKISQLSKGYRQRVGLAHALLHKPEILILDEPTTGLDPNQLSEIRNLIKSESKNKAVLFSTHIMQEVEALCDRVIIINKGEIVAQGSLAEIKMMGKSLEEVFRNLTV